MSFVLIAGMVAAFATLTWRQTGFWRDDKALWTHTLEVDGNSNCTAHTALGIYHFEYDHDLDKVMEHYATVISNDVQYVDTHAFLYMFALCEENRMSEAKKLLDWHSRWSQTRNDRRNAREGVPQSMAGFREDRPAPQYSYCRIAYFMKIPELRSIAEEELRGMLASNPDSQHLNYLAMRLCEEKGDLEGAEKWRQRAIRCWKRSDYMRYRFLRKEGDAL